MTIYYACSRLLFLITCIHSIVGYSRLRSRSHRAAAHAAYDRMDTYQRNDNYDDYHYFERMLDDIEFELELLKEMGEEQIEYIDESKKQCQYPGAYPDKYNFNFKHDYDLMKDEYQTKIEEYKQTATGSNDDYTKRDLHRNLNHQNNQEGFKFKVMQFNMLADMLCGAYGCTDEGTDNEYRFMYWPDPDHKEIKYVDDAMMAWRSRGIRVVEELVRHEADVIGVQECDQFEFIDKYMKQQGYQGVFMPKMSYPGSRTFKSLETDFKRDISKLKKPNAEGVALWFKTDKFKIVGQPKGSTDEDIQTLKTKEANGEEISENDRKEMHDLELEDAMIDRFSKELDKKEDKRKKFSAYVKKMGHMAVDLEVTQGSHQGEQIRFLVAHLDSDKNDAGEYVRVRQMQYLLNKWMVDDRPIVMMADLNGMAIRKDIQDKKTSGVTNWAPRAYELITAKRQFRSVYATCLGEEPEFSTCKLRVKAYVEQLIDFIFVHDKSHRWRVDTCLKMPKKLAILPNWINPSDHYSLVADIELVGN